jgi:cold-inducible RNA-binding protein
MSKKLFVGGLPFATDDDRLREVFEAQGEVTEAKVIMDRDTGKPRGFGFVTYKNDDDAETAMQQLDRSDFDGRQISVQPATERRSSGGSGGGEHRSGGDRGGRRGRTNGD